MLLKTGQNSRGTVKNCIESFALQGLSFLTFNFDIYFSPATLEKLRISVGMFGTVL